GAGEPGVRGRRTEGERERVRPWIVAFEPDDETREERVAAADRVPPPLVEHALVARAGGCGHRPPVRPPSDDARMAVPAGELAELRARDQRVVPAARGFA